MKLAVMQPYFFPYIGYFQLVNAVDKFVIYDDVNYIKNGWIDRNRILVNKQPSYFKIPLIDSSSYKLINNSEINYNLYFVWLNKFKKTLFQNYSKSPFFKQINDLILNILNTRFENVSNLNSFGLKIICDYLNVKTKIIYSSSIYNNKSLGRTERLIDICKSENANTYINLIGGKELYDKNIFKEQNIELVFLNPNIQSYSQFKLDFISSLSIIDVLMFNSKDELFKMLNKYDLV